jgi:adenylate cyclase
MLADNMKVRSGSGGSGWRVSWFWGDPTIAALPERVRRIIADEDRASEKLIGYVQLGIGLTLWALYLIAPRPADAALAMFSPVPFALGAFTLFSLVRVWLILKARVPDWFVALSIAADVALVLSLIWSFHLQYGHSAGFALKAPTYAYLFLLVVLRSLRFDPRYVLSAGVTGAIGWAGLTALAVYTDGGDHITRSFGEYLLSDKILIGAEVEKVLVLIVVSSLLAVGARRAQGTLVASLREQAALHEVRRFLPQGVADQIAASEMLIEAGHAADRNAAILFLDIRGFTPLSMRLPPSEVVNVLTAFHARIIPVVRAHHGVIDKFLGDGVMATFGAAENSLTPAADALRALEGILDEIEGWQTEIKHFGVSGILQVNAAIASGRVVFCTLGGGDRLEYTVIGEAVNLAAKLEKHNKVANSVALISEDTAQSAFAQGYQPVLLLEQLRDCHVSGVAQPLTLRAVMSSATVAS